MSRPYLRIDNVSYSTASNTLSVSLHALRIRGYDSENDIIIEGFSQSKTIPVSNGFFQGTVTYSVPDLETSTASTSPTTTYVAATVDWTFGGTALDGDTVNFGTDLGIRMQNGTYTFGNTYSVSDAVDLLAATISFNGLSASLDHFGFSASRVGDNVLRISAPWGAYYNGLNSDLTLEPGGSLTASSDTGSPTFSEFADGVTQYNLNFKRQNPLLGSLGVNTFNFEVGTYAVGS